MKKKITLVGMALLALTACGPGEKKSDVVTADLSKFAKEHIEEGDIVKDAIYKVALITDSPFKGILNPQLYSDGNDSAIITNFSSIIFDRDSDFEVTDTGMAKLDIDIDNKKVVVTFRDGLKWSDGHPMTVDDMIFSIELIAHPDYTGVRYDDEAMTILGSKEFHEGKADHISGLKKLSDTQLEISFSELGAGIKTLGNGLVGQLSPKHYLEDVPVAQLEQSDKVRKNPLSNGPFVIKNIVPGESVEFEPNPYYYRPEDVQVAGLIIKVVPTSSALSSVKSGEFDTYANLPQDIYDQYKDLDNLTILGREDLYYQYLGFNLGHYDEAKGENVMDREAPISDVRVRKALSYALDIETITDAFYNGLRTRANSPVPPVFSKYYNDKIEGYPYEPEKAKALLDEAGLKDIDGDGIREDKDGKPLTLKLAFMSGSDIAEPISQAFLQNWKEVGVNVELTTGRLIEFNQFYEKVQANDDDIDMFVGAWGVGTNLNPFSSSGRNARFNFTRFVSEDNDKLMEATATIEGLKDSKIRQDAYREWQKYWVEDAVAEVPLMFRYSTSVYNKRVKYANVYLDDAKAREFGPMAVVAPEGFAATK